MTNERWERFYVTFDRSPTGEVVIDRIQRNALVHDITPSESGRHILVMGLLHLGLIDTNEVQDILDEID